MLKQKSRAISGIARLLDLAVIMSSFWIVAIAWKRATHLEPLGRLRSTGGVAEVAIHQYALLSLTTVLAWIAVTEWRESYRSHRSEHVWPFVNGHLATELLWVMAVATLTFLFKLAIVSRAFFLTFFPLCISALTARQLGTRAFLQYVRSKGRNLRRVVVVGESSRALQFSRFIEAEGGAGYQLVELATTAEAKLNENLNLNFDEAFLTLGDERTDVEEIVLKLVKRGKRVHIVPGLFDGSLFRQSLDEFAGVPVLSVGGHGGDPIEAAAKRFLDLIGASMLLVVFSPAILLSALLVKLSSPGPVFFSQERLGKNGRSFRILKFRTMLRDAEERLRADPALYQKYVENNFKLPKGEDPRIAPAGHFLRSTSFDELPQLFNVLKGDMSLVGPRPIVPIEINAYGDYGPLFLSVKPGLTGYWQINGRSEVSDYSRRTAFDIEYIRDQSFKTDVDILLKTIPAVLRRKGAH